MSFNINTEGVRSVSAARENAETVRDLPSASNSARATINVDVPALKRQRITLRDNLHATSAKDATDLCGVLGILDAILQQVEPTDRHGGYSVGETVVWTNPMGIDKHVGEVIALHRNGNLCVRDPEFGTTVDVHHTACTR